jgi:uncharacterized coiled-coil protein SlyX
VPRKRLPRPEGHEDWLRRGVAARRRPWALEEALLAPQQAPERERQLAALANRILDERIQLERLAGEITEREALIAELEEQLRGLVNQSPSSTPSQAPSADASAAPTPGSLVELGQSHAVVERDYLLSRCHGFRVDSDDHTLGFVEGVRFGSSATRPDVIEVRSGRFRHRLVLVSVEDVDDIVEEEEAVFVRAAEPRPDLAHALLARLRGRSGHQVAT